MRRGSRWLVAVCRTIAGACGTDRLQNTEPGGRGTGGFSSTGGAMGAGTGVGDIPLTPSATGSVQYPPSKLFGSWYPFADSIGPNPTSSSIDIENSDCVKNGQFMASQCSMVTSPIAGQPFAPDPSTGAMCTSGVAAMVLPASNGGYDYGDLWGAGIGLDFDNPGADASAKVPWNGSAYTGIGFDITGGEIPINQVRVLFPFVGQHGSDAPYWDGETLEHSPLTTNTTVAIHWTDVAGPYYLTQATPPVMPPRFDPTQVLSIQFQVFTNTTSPTPYSFCVSNLRLLTD